VDEVKGVVLVELEPGQPPRVREVPLARGRRLRRFEGTLAELEVAASSIRDELCLLKLVVDTAVPDLSARVAELLPNAVIVNIEERVANRKLTPADELDTGGREPTLVEHFRGYLEAQGGTRAAAADRVLAGFSRFYEALAAEEEPSFPEERLLLDGGDDR
jgi:exonuclease SbcD